MRIVVGGRQRGELPFVSGRQRKPVKRLESTEKYKAALGGFKRWKVLLVSKKKQSCLSSFYTGQLQDWQTESSCHAAADEGKSGGELA